MELTWIAAEYHLPSAYACRMPMSSPVAARALPTPGPATIRLALIRNAIELFGITATRDGLFPAIRAMPIRIQPPERVAISQQQLNLYKGTTVNKGTYLQEAIGYREVAVADGPLTIYLQLERDKISLMKMVLLAVGAWGSADSLAWCQRISEEAPHDEVVIPLQQISTGMRMQQRYTGLATEFRDQWVTWEEIGAARAPGTPDAIRSSLWLWPLEICEQRSMSALLRRCSHA